MLLMFAKNLLFKDLFKMNEPKTRILRLDSHAVPVHQKSGETVALIYQLLICSDNKSRRKTIFEYGILVAMFSDSES